MSLSYIDIVDWEWVYHGRQEIHYQESEKFEDERWGLFSKKKSNGIDLRVQNYRWNS